MNIAVTTAVTGGYDTPLDHSVYTSGVDYFFFTDWTVEPANDRWETVSLPTDFSDDPRRLAKIPKMAPHRFDFLKAYDYVIWIDGSMVILDDNFPNHIVDLMKDSGLLLSPHFDGRDCGYGEATIRPPKYANENFDGQCDFYRSEGFPEHYGLWEAGVQCKCMNIPLVEQFGEVWLQQIMDWTTQDQVSLGYSLWKTGLVPDVMPKSWREYGWLTTNLHNGVGNG